MATDSVIGLSLPHWYLYIVATIRVRVRVRVGAKPTRMS